MNEIGLSSYRPWTMRLVNFIWLLLIITVSSSTVTVAQYNINENKVWVFGNRSGLDFNNASPVPIRTAITHSTLGGLWESSASVCDRFGRLLFYTSGERVWDRTHQPMPNGNPISPSSTMPIISSSSQGSVILPVIDSPGKYYIFAVTNWEQKRFTPPYDGRLFYSIVDMSLNNNLGDLVSQTKWIQLDSGLTETIIAVPGKRNNIWLIAHANYSNEFRVWEITVGGISSTPQIFAAGISGSKPYIAIPSPPTYANSWWTFGQMAISPDNTKLGVVYSRANYAELYDFDACTGAVSNPVLIDSLQPGLTSNSSTHFGIAFSPNSRMLYISGIPEIGFPANALFLYQFDISNPTRTAIAASKTRIGLCGYSKLRLAPNDKIYALNTDSVVSRYLDAVNFPDLPGIACQFVQRVITLEGYGDIGIGNDFVQASYLDTVRKLILDTSFCEFPKDGFVVSAPAGYQFYIWDDGSNNPDRLVNEQGLYYVHYGNACEVFTDSFRISAAELPAFKIMGPDSILCNVDSVILTISADSMEYLWQNGQTNRSITVRTSGRYIASIQSGTCKRSDTIDIQIARWEMIETKDYSFCQHDPISMNLSSGAPNDSNVAVMWNDGSTAPHLVVQDSGSYFFTITAGSCVHSDTIRITRQICFCEPLIPNAFSPNRDGKNDVFRVMIPADCPVKDFNLRIYDRWGKMVFSTTDPYESWDGTLQNMDAEVGTYMYMMEATTGSKQRSFKQKGDLLLIR